jgi:hypothetical protein
MSEKLFSAKFEDIKSFLLYTTTDSIKVLILGTSTQHSLDFNLFLSFSPPPFLLFPLFTHYPCLFFSFSLFSLSALFLFSLVFISSQYKQKHICLSFSLSLSFSLFLSLSLPNLDIKPEQITFYGHGTEFRPESDFWYGCRWVQFILPNYFPPFSGDRLGQLLNQVFIWISVNCYIFLQIYTYVLMFL